MISDTTWFWLERYGILVGDLLMTATLIGAVWGFLRRDNIRRWFSRNRFPDVGGELAPQATPFDGLILVVSKADVPRWLMRQLRPAWVAFAASGESALTAQSLDTEASSLGLTVVGLMRIDDADDPAATRRTVMDLIGLLRQAGAANIAVDLTGGKTPMSLGAFMAAEEHGVSSIYVASEFDSTLNQPKMQTARIVNVSRPL